MKAVRLAFLLLIFGLLSSRLVLAQEAIRQYGLTNDLWDISQGTLITGFSKDAAQQYDTATEVPYAENMLGARHTGFPREDGAFIFSDHMPEGFVHFVEWRTLRPIQLRSFQLYAANDGEMYGYQRSFGSFTLKTKSPGSTDFDVILYTYTPVLPYEYVDADGFLLVNAEVMADNAQEFRAEFTDNALTGLSAPRIIEMDGLGEPPPVIGATNDLWDVSQGTVITDHSPEGVAMGGQPSAAENIFGATSPSFPFGLSDFLFQDGQANGYVHYVEWHTATPVTVKSFKLYATGDGSALKNQREFASFVLKTKSPGSDLFDQELYRYSPIHPYLFYDFNSELLIQGNFGAVTAQDFRAEFVNHTIPNTAASGPRIIELDGFAESLPLELRARLVIELSWPVEPGKVYQLQSKFGVGDLDWQAVGDPLTATGFSQTWYQAAREASLSIYRVIEVTGL